MAGISVEHKTPKVPTGAETITETNNPYLI